MYVCMYCYLSWPVDYGLMSQYRGHNKQKRFWGHVMLQGTIGIVSARTSIILVYFWPLYYGLYRVVQEVQPKIRNCSLRLGVLVQASWFMGVRFKRVGLYGLGFGVSGFRVWGLGFRV